MQEDRESDRCRGGRGLRAAARFLSLASVFLCLGPMVQPVAAQTLTTLFSFDGAKSGSQPLAPLIFGSDGNYYGTASGGGTGNAGTVFNMTPGGVFTTLISFSGPNNGSQPTAPLLLGSDGNYYGTTSGGGTGGAGTVFNLTPGGILTTLFAFDNFPRATNFGPNALIQGTDGNYYGTTTRGGASDNGTIFRMTPAGALTTILSFNTRNGSLPTAGLIQATDGNFYGTTSAGGANASGTIFRMTPAGVLTTLLSFNGANGLNPNGLLQGSDGNLYGTTSGGGANDFGTAFEITTGGAFTSLLSFGGANGSTPQGRLIQAVDGNFYGTTSAGGTNGSGTVFLMTPAGALTSLVSFTGANGGAPQAGLIQASDGSFYGTTSTGGANSLGTIFNLSLLRPQTITFGPLAPVSVGNPDFTLTATASSGLPVSYTSSNPNVASVTGGTVHIVSAGSTIITASQAGDKIWAPATPVPQTLTVAAAMKLPQTIAFGPLADMDFANPPFQLSAISTSGLPVSYSSSNPAVATVSGSTVTLLTAGVTTITATQAGDATYLPATPVTQSLTVTVIVSGAGSMAGFAVPFQGNLYDIVLMTGPGVTVNCVPGHITRVAFVDPNDDIVFAEFGGTGLLTTNLANATGPAAAVLYNQPNVLYMKGLASFSIVNPTPSTFFSCYSLGNDPSRIDPSLVKPGAAIDGVADIALISINGSALGGLNLANTRIGAASGEIGISAPGTTIGQYWMMGDMHAQGTAIPDMIVGGAPVLSIAGGSFLQTNGQEIVYAFKFGFTSNAGATSTGVVLPAQPFQGTFLFHN